MTVTPDSGLSSGDTVAVSVTGFTAGEFHVAVQCANFVGSDVVCNNADAVPVDVDETGAGTASLVVRATFDDHGVGVDCTGPRFCVIVATNEAGTNWVFAPIAFAPAG